MGGRKRDRWRVECGRMGGCGWMRVGAGRRCTIRMATLMCVCVCVCVCVYVCMYVRMYVYMYARMHACMHEGMYMYVQGEADP